MKFKWTTNLETTTYTDALKIRKKVFVEEQKVPLELEIDELEDKTLHVVAYSNHTAVATARIYEKFPKIYKIQRVAVDSDVRGQHLGVQLMKEVERYILEAGGHTMVLDAQDYAMPFYEKLDFQITNSEGFMDAGIPHHSMKKEMTPSKD